MFDQVDPSSLRTIVLRKRTHQSTFGLYLADDYPRGIYIVTIEQNSPAADAKIQPGDRLLAVNGHWVRLMLNNPKETIYQIAQYSQSLTVTIQPSDLVEWLRFVNEVTLSEPKLSNQRTIFVERDFERYVKSLLVDEITQFIDNDHHSKHHRQRRRRRERIVVDQQTQTDLNSSETPTQRTIPSMGTSHAILRRSQSSNKSQTIESMDQLKEENPSLSSIPKDKKRQICLTRSVDFEGFGFHVDSKNRRHRVYRLEPNSPAEKSGLRVNDMILQVNEQSTENMPTNTFVDLIKRSRTIHLLVENLQDISSIKKPSLKETLSRLTNRSSQENR